METLSQYYRELFPIPIVFSIVTGRHDLSSFENNVHWDAKYAAALACDAFVVPEYEVQWDKMLNVDRALVVDYCWWFYIKTYYETKNILFLWTLQDNITD